MDVEYAMQLADKTVSKIGELSNIELELIPSKTVELEEGWVFFWHSSLYLRTLDPAYDIGGGGPIFVMKDGSIHQLPGWQSWKKSVQSIIAQPR